MDEPVKVETNQADKPAELICWPESDRIQVNGELVQTRGWRSKQGVLRGSYPNPIPGRCGRRLRYTWPVRYCKRRPEHGTDRCHYHGANLVAGPAHPTWKHGRNSLIAEKINGTLKAAYEAAMKDPKLLSAAPNAALWDARIIELLDLLQQQEASGLWGRVGQAWGDHKEMLRDLVAAVRAGDQSRFRQSLARLEEQTNRSTIDQIIEKGSALDSVWREIKEADDHSVRAKAVEQKRRNDQRQMIPIAQFRGILSAIEMAIFNALEDKRQMAAVQREYRRLVAPIAKGLSE
jgi:hypothetical protein